MDKQSIESKILALVERANRNQLLMKTEAPYLGMIEQYKKIMDSAASNAGSLPKPNQDLIDRLKAQSLYYTADSKPPAVGGVGRIGQPISPAFGVDEDTIAKVIDKYAPYEADTDGAYRTQRMFDRLGSFSGRQALSGKFPSWLQSLVQKGQAIPGATAEIFKDLMTSGRMNAIGPIVPDFLIQNMYQKALMDRRTALGPGGA